MNKQLAKNGTMLNKNMTNTDSLSLTFLQYTSASFITCNSSYIKSNDITCLTLDLPTTISTTFIAGTAYYNFATKSLRIYDGLHWYQIILTQVP